MREVRANWVWKAALVGMLWWSVLPLCAAPPWLQVEGNKIKDPSGNEVVLRGVSLPDLGVLQGQQGGALPMIDRLTNRNDSQGSSPGWYPKVLRIPIYPPDSGWTPVRWTAGDDSYYTSLLRPVVDYCAKKNLYAIIDWHYVDDTTPKMAVTSEFWRYMAPRFANDSHVFFELFNEPMDNVGTEQQRWHSVKTDMQTWVNLVRSYCARQPDPRRRGTMVSNSVVHSHRPDSGEQYRLRVPFLPRALARALPQPGLDRESA